MTTQQTRQLHKSSSERPGQKAGSAVTGDSGRSRAGHSCALCSHAGYNRPNGHVPGVPCACPAALVRPPALTRGPGAPGPAPVPRQHCCKASSLLRPSPASRANTAGRGLPPDSEARTLVPELTSCTPPPPRNRGRRSGDTAHHQSPHKPLSHRGVTDGLRPCHHRPVAASRNKRVRGCSEKRKHQEGVVS